jgi:hypothetical protein
MRIALILALCLIIAGCPRTAEINSTRANAKATHPWELPGWQDPRITQLPQGNAEVRGTGGKVELPSGRGPALPDTDSMDPQLVPGAWMRICSVAEERFILNEVALQDVMQFAEGGAVVFYTNLNGKPTTINGSWRKMDFGVVGLTMNRADEEPFYGQIFQHDFMYMWSYRHGRGWWTVRVPEQRLQALPYNRFKTSRGDLLIKTTLGPDITGVVSGAGNMEVSGYFREGILSLRWADKKNNAKGYAAFIVSADGSQLRGAWWLADFQAAPFGGIWDGEAVK